MKKGKGWGVGGWVGVYAHALSCVLLFATLWTIAYKAPLSMELSRQECWSGLLFSPPGDCPNTGTEPASPVLQAGFFTNEPPGKPMYDVYYIHIHIIQPSDSAKGKDLDSMA